ncbi:ESCRT-0 subunit protein VPS27 Ecym_2123 [Eremothecium cymbalariae DBVPG|uniref:Vacuolar protein sorting-associated protein 27 n=1 Tax=Eremothecium cymbalariae (strain CBS 270.75 / DBVPG 7215 / KCTC 17166 / NRRL Y-17582) TaxID=931890 RepID=G8JPM7_ERECY|nr:Hypothetical protein Ecym_2123 [Eremothecium cymbalariae DBVPG\
MHHIMAVALTVHNLDLLIQKATSESIPNGEIDLPVALEVSDVIRSRSVTPKQCMRCLKKRVLQSRQNPHTQLASWKLVEVCIKNGGTPFLKEVCSREFMDCLENVILQGESDDDAELEQLCSRLVFELYTAFKNDSQLNYVSKVYQRLVNRGVDFPTDSLNYVDGAGAMFDSKTPADWVDSDACMICSMPFTFLKRKHHCRSCGGIFCQEHSSSTIPLPDLGILHPVRVCDNCHDDYGLKKQTSKKSKKHSQRKERHRDSQQQDDENLRRAIELSLKESRNQDTIVPEVTYSNHKSKTADEEDDPDLRAAIEASLREHALEQERLSSRSNTGLAQPIIQSPQPIQQQPRQAFIPKQPFGPELTSSEQEDIQLFATLVEKMKTQPPTAVLEDSQLQQLYQKVIGTRPKLNHALNDTYQKYNSLLDMNAKISDIMNIYDAMLEKQLRNINLSQQYSILQMPSDPYSYQLPHKTTVHEPRRLNQDRAQPQPGKIALESPINRSHASDLQNILIEPTRNRIDEGQSLSPYPLSEEYPQVSDTLSKVREHENETHLSSEPPYPREEAEANSEDRIQPNIITNFDFPVVPNQKIQVANEDTEIDERAESNQDLLLIEL